MLSGASIARQSVVCGCVSPDRGNDRLKQQRVPTSLSSPLLAPGHTPTEQPQSTCSGANQTQPQENLEQQALRLPVWHNCCTVVQDPYCVLTCGNIKLLSSVHKRKQLAEKQASGSFLACALDRSGVHMQQGRVTGRSAAPESLCPRLELGRQTCSSAGLLVA
jgi:hypothetical protein